MAWTEDLGIHQGNTWGNLFTYSLMAYSAFDSAASAAGKIDVEAARYLRTAQGMVHRRLDMIIAQVWYGPTKQINGHEVRMQISPRSLASFREIFPVCAQDTAALIQRDGSAFSDLEKVGSHQKQEFDGALLDNLDNLIRAEIALHGADPHDILSIVCDAQAEMLGHLMIAAATIADFIMHAAKILKEKLNALPELYVCSSCGLLSYEIPEKCWLCEAPASLIVGYPFNPGPVVRIMEREFFRQTGM